MFSFRPVGVNYEVRVPDLPWCRPSLLILSLMLFGCTPYSNSKEIEFGPSPQPSAKPTAVDIASQNFADEWKSRYDELKKEIGSSRSKWAAKKISSYSFKAAKNRGGHTSPWNRSPVLIRVVDGQSVSKELPDKSDVSEMARTDGFEEFDTVDKLFDYMLSELESGRIVTAKYDGRLHYPRNIWITEWIGPHGSRFIEIDELKPL